MPPAARIRSPKTKPRVLPSPNRASRLRAHQGLDSSPPSPRRNADSSGPETVQSQYLCPESHNEVRCLLPYVSDRECINLDEIARSIRFVALLILIHETRSVPGQFHFRVFSA